MAIELVRIPWHGWTARRPYAPRQSLCQTPCFATPWLAIAALVIQVTPDA